jgi:hypothetical protein
MRFKSIGRYAENSVYVLNIPYGNLDVGLLQETGTGVEFFAFWEESAESVVILDSSLLHTVL